MPTKSSTAPTATNKASKKPGTKKAAAKKSTAKKAATTAPAGFPEIVSETRIVRGIRLPWQRIERYGPQWNRWKEEWTDAPAKGSVIESGEVFIPISTLEELVEQDVWDSQFGSAFLLGFHEGLALEAAGLAEQETRGGFHRTDALKAFLDHYYATQSES